MNLDKIEVKYSMLENSTPYVIELAKELNKKQAKTKGKVTGKRTSGRGKKKKDLMTQIEILVHLK